MSSRLKSVFNKNEDAFNAIVCLYFHKGMVVRDVTYGKGVFWKSTNITEFDFVGSDINGEIKYDFNNLPFVDKSIDAVIFDPPYRYSPVRGITRKGFEDRYKIQSTAPKNVQNVIAMYKNFIINSNYLRDDGLMILKCQDTIQDGNQHWVHLHIFNFLLDNGFVIEDLAIVTTNTKNVRWEQQFHLDKTHSYFLVARRKSK